MNAICKYMRWECLSSSPLLLLLLPQLYHRLWAFFSVSHFSFSMRCWQCYNAPGVHTIDFQISTLYLSCHAPTSCIYDRFCILVFRARHWAFSNRMRFLSLCVCFFSSFSPLLPSCYVNVSDKLISFPRFYSLAFGLRSRTPVHLYARTNLYYFIGFLCRPVILALFHCSFVHCINSFPQIHSPFRALHQDNTVNKKKRNGTMCASVTTFVFAPVSEPYSLCLAFTFICHSSLIV